MVDSGECGVVPSANDRRTAVHSTECVVKLARAARCGRVYDGGGDEIASNECGVAACAGWYLMRDQALDCTRLVVKMIEAEMAGD